MGTFDFKNQAARLNLDVTRADVRRAGDSAEPAVSQTRAGSPLLRRVRYIVAFKPYRQLHLLENLEQFAEGNIRLPIPRRANIAEPSPGAPNRVGQRQAAPNPNYRRYLPTAGNTVGHLVHIPPERLAFTDRQFPDSIGDKILWPSSRITPNRQYEEAATRLSIADAG